MPPVRGPILLSLVRSLISLYLPLSLTYVVLTANNNVHVCFAVVSVSMYTCPLGPHDEY